MNRVKRWNGEEAAAFGARLRALRTSAGMSQRDLADGTTVTAAYLSRIENGERYPSVSVIRELAGNLGMDADVLERVVDKVRAIASVEQIDAVAARWGVDLRWHDLSADEQQTARRGLNDALVDTLVARIHALALGRSAA
jgi:transcriptional regulator with XRE-family HTH domain